MKRKSGRFYGTMAVILYDTARGDHDIWYSPITGRNITVDGEIRIRHVANGIMKQAGIDYHF
jgi:hypothetical protein